MQRLTLDDGRSIVIDERSDRQLPGGTFVAAHDVRLLISGSGAGSRWWIVLVEMNPGGSLMPADCYGLDAEGTDQGEEILFDFGLRLPKSHGFDPGVGLSDGRYDAPGGGGGPARFCINPDGEVTAYNV